MVDSVIYIDYDAATAEVNDEYYSNEFFQFDAAYAAQQMVWSRSLFKTKNPLAAAPQVRVSCAKWAYPWPGAKICIGHKYEWRYMYTEATLTVSMGEPGDIRAIIEGCLRDAVLTAAISSIISALATGGATLPAAIASFESKFRNCILSKAAGASVSISLDLHNTWGDWE